MLVGTGKRKLGCIAMSDLHGCDTVSFLIKPSIPNYLIADILARNAELRELKCHV